MSESVIQSVSQCVCVCVREREREREREGERVSGHCDDAQRRMSRGLQHFPHSRNLWFGHNHLFSVFASALLVCKDGAADLAA